MARRWPFLFTGWFWFAGTLVPVIGLIQVGDAAMADRYTYLPHIGLFIALVWGAAALAQRWQVPKPALVWLAALGLVACAWLTRIQIGYWTDSGTLFNHARRVIPNNSPAENQLGIWYSANGRITEAMECFQRAVQIRADNQIAYKNLGESFAKQGQALIQQGRWTDAVTNYHQALRFDPANVAALYNLGNAFARQGLWDQAIDHYRRALQARPDQVDALNNLGFALSAKGQFAEALTCYEAALKWNTNSAETHNNLATLYFRQTNFTAAADHYFLAARLEPNQAPYVANLGDALLRLGKIPEAAQCYQRARQLDPSNPRYQAKLQALTEPPKN
jgi:tetratricopeptide (TPR) repeat protein